jgi:alpha-galactosidase
VAAKIVGKSSGWVGEADTYRKNKGTVGHKQITFIGASYKFVHKVLRDMLLVGGFNDVELVLHDIDEVPLRIVGDLLERIARQQKTKITVRRTTNRAEALKGADIVILAITIGGNESDQRSFEVCAKYGIPVGVGDTMGPTALARNLREVPVVVDMARDMDRLCPKALMLNFTNPMSAITGAMARYSSIPCWGLCHSADSLFDYFAKVFKVPKTAVDLEVGGVNHQSFVTKVLIKGKDRTSEILEASLKSDAKFEDNLLEVRKEEVNLQQDVYKILGCWPSCGDAHLAEFYRFFFTPRRVDKFRHELRHILAGREPIGRKPCPQIIHDWAYGPEPVGDLHLLTSEHSHELMWAYLTGEPFSRVLNLLNTGEYLKGIAKDACVEAMVTVTGRKVTGKSITLPPAIHSLVTNWTAVHDLSIKAAMNCDRQAAKQALFIDPHVTDMYDIDGLLEDMLTALKPWLPEKWFAGKK